MISFISRDTKGTIFWSIWEESMGKFRGVWSFTQREPNEIDRDTVRAEALLWF